MPYTRIMLIIITTLMIKSNSLAAPEDHFVTTWKTDNPGTSNNSSITIPANAATSGYSYSVDWNNDNIPDETGITGSVTHDFVTPGTYTIRIFGDFPRIYFNNGGDKQKILSIEQWGTNSWASMEDAFSGTVNLINNANDTPDLSGVTNMSSMFVGASSIGADSETSNWNWNTSTVENMNLLFSSATVFNQDISNWNTELVEDMGYLFSNASAFNQDISAWNTNSLQSMPQIFSQAVTFDQDISSWNVQNVTNFIDMFIGSGFSTTNYDKLLASWWTQSLQSNKTISIPTTAYCSQAAQDGRASMVANFNWTFNDAGLDPDCDTSILENHFVITVNTENAGTSGPASFTIPVTGSDYNYSIDINNDGIFEVTGITGGFTANFGSAGIHTIRIAGDFPRIYFNEEGDKDKILSVEQWGSTRWSSMVDAFSGASNLVINATDTPDLSNVSSLFKMFKGVTNLGNGSGNWAWDTSNIEGMVQTFQDASNFDKDISLWNIENVTNIANMLTGVTLSDANYDALLISWDTQNVNPSLSFNGGNSQYCSQEAVKARLNLEGSDFWNITDGAKNPTCDITDKYFVTTWKTDNSGPSNDSSITIPTTGTGYSYGVDWDNDNIIDEFDINGTVTHDFGAPGTYTIRIYGDFPRILFNQSGDKEKLLSIDQWGTNSWQTMAGSFSGCTNLQMNASDTPDLSEVEDLSPMFIRTPNLHLSTGNWNWNTNNIERLTNIFAYSSFDFDISSWNIENVTVLTSMFFDSTLSNTNYEALLISWDTQNVNPALNFHGGNSQYCSQAAADARANLINADLWTISDGGSCNDAPVFTTLDEIDMPENQTSVTAISATDTESDTVTYTKTGGADEALFTLNATTGELNFVTVPNFENPGSSLSTNTYVIEITATDDGVPIESTSQTFMVTVTDVVEEDPSTFFTTTWKTDNPSTSNDTSITIPTTPFLSDVYAYFVDWNGDGDFEDTGENIRHTDEATFDYGVVGTYTINIKGDFPRIYFAGATDKTKIISIDQWGTTQWKSMNQAFSGATNVVNKAQDTPDLSNSDTLSQMFLDADMIGSENDTGNWDWDISTINDLTNMFKGAHSFNKNLNNWNTSGVFTMVGVFDGATVFNQNLDNWVTSNVQRMDTMFHNARAFDQDLSNWNIENVEVFSRFLRGATLSTSNYEALLISWSSQTVSQNELFDGGNSQFCSQAAIQARQALENVYSWNITDGEIDQSCADGIDLSISISDNTTSFLPGDIIDYVVTVTNTSSTDAIDTRLRFYDDYELIELLSWDCDQINDPTCTPSPNPSENQDGGANIMIDIPANNVITYTFTAQVVNEPLEDNLEVIVDISLSDYQYDKNQSNNDVTDINVNQDFVFKNGFEEILRRTVNTSEKQIEFDFSKIKLSNLGKNPKAIVKGLNEDKQTNLWIHVRNYNQQMQIRLSNKVEGNWLIGTWQDIYKTEPTTLVWY